MNTERGAAVAHIGRHRKFFHGLEGHNRHVIEFSPVHIRESSRSYETVHLPPHVTIHLPESATVEVIKLHQDHPHEVMKVDQKDNKLHLPSGGEYFVGINGYPFHIRDHTSNPDNGKGTRGVSIMHGQTLQHEVRTRTYTRSNGESKTFHDYIYSMPAGKRIYAHEGDTQTIAGVRFDYKPETVRREAPSRREKTIFRPIEASSYRHRRVL